MRNERVQTESTVKKVEEEAIQINTEKKIASLIKEH